MEAVPLEMFDQRSLLDLSSEGKERSRGRTDQFDFPSWRALLLLPVADDQRPMLALHDLLDLVPWMPRASALPVRSSQPVFGQLRAEADSLGRTLGAPFLPQGFPILEIAALFVAPLFREELGTHNQYSCGHPASSACSEESPQLEWWAMREGQRVKRSVAPRGRPALRETGPEIVTAARRFRWNPM